MDQLKLLMDYTKFHIGFYLTFGSIGITLVKMGRLEYVEAIPGIILMLIAGAAEGLLQVIYQNIKTGKVLPKLKLNCSERNIEYMVVFLKLNTLHFG